MLSPVETFWSIKLSDVISTLILLATIFAIYFGPIRAVEISRRNDLSREAERRKREIFGTLMRTRRAAMNPDQVWALNFIQLEFYGCENVQRAYKEYIANLSEAVPAPGAALDSLLQRRADRFFDLLHEIAKVLSLNLDKRDLERAAYIPVGWANDEDEIRLFRRAVIDLLHGKRPLAVIPFQVNVPNLYPPAPGGNVGGGSQNDDGPSKPLTGI